MDYSNDWDLQAVVRSCAGAPEEAAPAPPPPPEKEARREIVNVVGRRAAAAAAAATPEFVGRPVRPAAALIRDLDYLDLDHELPRAPFSITPSSERGQPLDHEVLFSFPAASTSGQQQLIHPRKQPGRKPGFHHSTDHLLLQFYNWVFRGYYKCSSLKACMARKLVERSPANPGMLVVTYIAEHCHAVPTMLNALAGTTRHRTASSPGDDHHASDEASTGRRGEDSADASSMTVDGGGGGAETADDENEPWQQVDMALEGYPLELDDFLGGFDEDFDRFFEGDDDGVLERRVSL
ncbi:hypothetical protein HU200_026334 [Digitaria exilis]|uniref:WRKY domain-containing protein n=1 Tax=Digitaria exilis TaxID=1010633 RepID=A0A835C7G6_9POAL|nr:hypothetical protein HU200_026334 [Digitaria exilis]